MRPPMPSSVRVVFVAVLAVVFAPASAWAQKKVTLKLNLKAGEAYTLTATSKRQSSVTFGGLARKESETATVTVTLKPTEVDKDGTVHGTFTYDAVRVEGDGPDGKYAYDSAKDKEAPTAPAAQKYATLVGRPLEVVVTSLGEVTSVKGAEDVADAILEAIEVADDRRDAVDQEIRASAGNEGLKEAIQKLIPRYPEKPVPVKTAWTIEQTFTTLPPAVTVHRSYGLHSATGGKVTLIVQGAVRSPEGSNDDDDDDAKPAGPTFDLKGTESGGFVVDQATGWIISGGLRASLSGTRAMGTGARGASVPAKFQSEWSVEPPKK